MARGKQTTSHLRMRRRTLERYLRIIDEARGRSELRLAIAQRLRIHPMTVTAACRALGLNYRSVSYDRSGVGAAIRRLRATTKSIRSLEERDATIVRLYDRNAGLTMKTLGERFGIRRQRVQQILCAAGFRPQELRRAAVARRRLQATAAAPRTSGILNPGRTVRVFEPNSIEGRPLNRQG